MWAYIYTCSKILPFYGFLLFVLHLPFFIIFRLFPSMALIENISFAENIFHLKNFLARGCLWSCVLLVCMVPCPCEFVHMPWYIGPHGVCTFLFSTYLSFTFCADLQRVRTSPQISVFAVILWVLCAISYSGGAIGYLFSGCVFGCPIFYQMMLQQCLFAWLAH